MCHDVEADLQISFVYRFHAVKGGQQVSGGSVFIRTKSGIEFKITFDFQLNPGDPPFRLTDVAGVVAKKILA